MRFPYFRHVVLRRPHGSFRNGGSDSSTSQPVNTDESDDRKAARRKRLSRHMSRGNAGMGGAYGVLALITIVYLVGLMIAITYIEPMTGAVAATCAYLLVGTAHLYLANRRRIERARRFRERLVQASAEVWENRPGVEA